MADEPKHKTQVKNKQRLASYEKAKTILEVLRETGAVGVEEIWKRLQGKVPAHSLFDDGAISFLMKMIEVDPAALENIKPNQILKSLLEDIKLIDSLLTSGNISIAEMNKLIGTKTALNTLLGKFVGMWNADATVEKPDSAEEIYKRYSSGNRTLDKTWDANSQKGTN